MFERFTERARQVIALAQDEARNERLGYIGTEQILLGLLGESEGLAAKVLQHLGVTLEKAREGVNARITARRRDDEELQGQIPFTPRAKKVLETALREALSLGHNYIGTEHIALGIIREGNNIAVEILRDDFGLSVEKIRKEIMRTLSGPKAPVFKRDSVPAARITREVRTKEDDELEQLINMAVHLGRSYPDVSASRIVKAVIILHRD